MKLPDALRDEIEAAHGAVTRVQAVSGGCISHTARVEFGNGDVAFLKWSTPRDHPREMMAEEARSLRAIAETNTVRVPAVMHVATGDEFVWLLLEWLPPGPRTAANQQRLGRQLAELHRHTAESYGWPADNFIGSLPQSNRWHTEWPHFWRAERLAPQMREAAQLLGANALRRIDALLKNVPSLLDAAHDEGPSLVHGDLWSGNVHMLANGDPAVIDPSCYYAHREVDIAMSRLFGGFSADFYDAYAEVWPHAAGLERRLLLYQLYYLLVHVNLFGGSYVQQTMSVVQQLGY